MQSLLLTAFVWFALSAEGTTMRAKQVRFFYLANQNLLHEFVGMLPKARIKTVEQALIYAATGDAVDVVEHLISDQSKFKFSRFHIRRTLELASEFGAANVVHYLLDSMPWEWQYDELERAERWSRVGEHRLTHTVIMNKMVELGQE